MVVAAGPAVEVAGSPEEAVDLAVATEVAIPAVDTEVDGLAAEAARAGPQVAADSVEDTAVDTEADMEVATEVVDRLSRLLR